MKIHIRGGRLIDPANQLDEQRDLFVEDGKVVALGNTPQGFEADRVIEAAGLVVCPGLIDLQVSLSEPGFTQKGTIRSETRAAVAGGVTTLCCLPNTAPVLDTPAVAQLIQDRAEEAGNARVLPLGALTKQLQGEQLSNMVSLKEAGCVALTNAGKPIHSNQTLLRCMEYAATYDLLMMVRPQDYELSKGGCAHDGKMASKLGLPGIPEAAETLDVSRYLVLAEQTGARIHFSQLTTPRAFQMVDAAQQRGVKVSADTAIQYLLLSDDNLENFDSAYHLIPPLRTPADRDGLQAALSGSVLQAICSDHQPQEAAAKEAPFGATEPGMIGLQTLLPLALKLVEAGCLSLPKMVEKLTTQPAKILGLELGNLGIGAEADICIFDPEAQWVFDEANSVSQSHNSPFYNQTLTGKVRYTLVAGQLVHELQ
ncbi:MAG: dihydroorotase [Motiliproteus sp.]|nr:dihydroorotase [Motiliproteus sp.]MCW9050836.1 dihydroorotase [Motiliproteus sp.]